MKGQVVCDIFLTIHVKYGVIKITEPVTDQLRGNYFVLTITALASDFGVSFPFT